MFYVDNPFEQLSPGVFQGQHFEPGFLARALKFSSLPVFFSNC